MRNSYKIYIFNGARNVLSCLVIWMMAESVLLVLKVIIATLLDILCLGTHISTKLLLGPKSGIPSRFCRFYHLSWTLGRCGQVASVPLSWGRDLPEPWFRQVKPTEHGTECSAGKSGKGFSPLSSRFCSLLAFRLWFEPAQQSRFFWGHLSVIAGEGIWEIQLVPYFLIFWCSSFIY